MFCPLLLGTVGMIAASLPVTAFTAHTTRQATQPEQTTQATEASLLAPSAGRNPYAGVFDPPRAVDQSPVRERRTAGLVVQGKPRVVCGMVIFDADPAFDARIRVPIPNADVQHAIRRIPAPACR